MLLELLRNVPLNTDAYKVSHYLQYPPGTQHISSYIESRGGKYDNVMSFGMQAFIKEYLTKPITRDDVDFAEKILKDGMNLPFNREGWEYIIDTHGGYLPVEIETVDEGTVLPNKNVMTQIVNTDPNCPWLTSYLETSLLRAAWFPNTVATVSWNTKQIIKKHMEKTSDNLLGLPFKLNDFGARGTSSNESAALGGMSHLVNFAGSDTVMGIVAANVYYGYTPEKQGVPAAEHSTITSWGKDREKDAYENMLKQFSGEGKIVAVVSDSYDLWNAVGNIWGGELKEQVVNNGGLVVIRPDSGDPVEVVCKTLDILSDKFGTEDNSKGYKVLPPYIRVIQGDGVSPQSIDAILTAMEEKGYSADNVVFGMGGELLQKLDRDTQKYAMKASAIRIEEAEGVTTDFIRSAFDIEGNWHDVYKDPKTDPGKKSKRGILALTYDENAGYITVRRDELAGRPNLLKTIFRNGKLLSEVTFDDVRSKADESTRYLEEVQSRKLAAPQPLAA
jgi:nicotinamide phosphoribosyltransferase